MGGCLERSSAAAEGTTLQPTATGGDATTSERGANLYSVPLVEEVEFAGIEESIQTGDLAVLYREGQDVPHFAVFIQHAKDDPDFPLLLLKGKTKPLLMENFNSALGREAYTTTAVQRIFYGDYKKVLVRHLVTDEELPIDKVMETVEKINEVHFSQNELEAIDKASTEDEKSGLVSAFVIAHFYELMPVSGDPIFNGDPTKVTPQSLEESLKLSKPKSIKLLSPRPGPLTTGNPPLLHDIL